MRAERVAARLAVRQTWLGAVGVAAATGLLLWLGTLAFHKSKNLGGVATLAANPAVSALLGPPTALHTLGGFAVWRVQLFVMILGPVWMILAATRVLRGSEEAGRLDLLLAGPLPLTGATAATLVALLGPPVLALLTVSAVLWGSGAATAGSWLYGVGFGLLLWTFGALAALASQLLPGRRQAAGLAGAVLFGTFLLRMYADGSKNAGWVRWLSPFGWLEQLHAFGGNDLLPLTLLLGVPVLLAAATGVLAARRDAGAGLVAADDTARPHTRLLTGPLPFAIRRRSRDMPGWALGMAVFGLMSGGLSASFVNFPETDPQYVAALTKAGMGAAVTVSGFVAIMNVFTAVVLAGYAIACVHADYEDEQAGRLDLPYSAPVSRTGWAGPAVAATAAALVVLELVLGLATWIGTQLSGAGLALGDSLASAMNVLPVPLLFLGLAVALHGVWPAWMVRITGLLAIGTYLIELIGPALSWPSWVISASPYHQLGLVPAQPAAWTALGVFLAVAAAGTLTGLAGYRRRDLQPA